MEMPNRATRLPLALVCASALALFEPTAAAADPIDTKFDKVIDNLEASTNALKVIQSDVRQLRRDVEELNARVTALEKKHGGRGSEGYDAPSRGTTAANTFGSPGAVPTTTVGYTPRVPPHDSWSVSGTNPKVAGTPRTERFAPPPGRPLNLPPPPFPPSGGGEMIIIVEVVLSGPR